MTLEAQTQIKCPECGSLSLFRDGLRYLDDGSTVQRFLCRDCGFRFSDPSKARANKECLTIPQRQICVTLQGAKNLTSATEIKTVAGDIEKLPPNTKGLVTKYMAYLEREGYYKETIYLTLVKTLAKDGCNLLDPEDVKRGIAQHKGKDRQGNPTTWKDTTKMLASYAYDAFCKMEGITWKPPRYRQGETILYVPDERDLDQLIAASNSKRMAAYLQTLKETFADPSEILRAEWIDLNENILTIRFPVKGHLAGRSKISSKLAAMLNSLPKDDKRIFPMTYHQARNNYGRLRKRAAAKLQNPKLLNVAFKSFRHWGGSMLAHYTNGNVLEVKRQLRHKNIQNTMKYIHTIEFKDEDFEETTATTPEEVRALGKAGWVKYDEMMINGVQWHFYRKPKRFGGMVW